MRVNLSSMPDPKSQSAITYDGMRGGLNLKDDPSRVGSTQSPDMLNMWYRDGVLKKRSGQIIITVGGSGGLGGKVWFYDKLFNGFVVYVRAGGFYYYDPAAPETQKYIQTDGTKAAKDRGHGTFFPFGEHLCYKADGCYCRISYADGALTAEDICWRDGNGAYHSNDAIVYTPIIAMNRNPDGTGGSLYQPENRINHKKEIWFDINDESHDYRLPVSGAKVYDISIGEDGHLESSSGITSGTVSVDGGSVPVSVVEADGATTLRFGFPLYVNAPNWSRTNDSYTAKVAAGDLGKQVVFSTKDILLPDIETLTRYKTVAPATNGGIPVGVSKSALDEARRRNPYYSSYDRIMILDNGEWCNFFFFKRKKLTEEPAIEDHIVTYDKNSTEVVLKNYVVVTLRRPNMIWSVQDFRGKTDSGWHFLKNCTYADFIWDDPEIAMLPTTPSWLHVHYTGSIGTYAGTVMAERYGTDPYPEILWISENDECWVFHYTTSANTVPFSLTKYDPDDGYFQAQGLTQITIYKDFKAKAPEVKVMNSPGSYGFLVKNIIYAAAPILYGDVTIGTSVIPKSKSSEVPDAYKKYAEIAQFKAGSGTGNYFIATTDEGIAVYVEKTDKSKLESYNPDTTEFAVSGYYRFAYTYLADRPELTLDTVASKSNKLKVTYGLANEEAMAAIVDSKIATSYGGSDAVCVVVGNCAAQPNAIFWSGNGSAGVDATYFPMDQYNLCGTYQDPVTAFGKQQNNLIVFQEHHIS